MNKFAIILCCIFAAIVFVIIVAFLYKSRQKTSVPEEKYKALNNFLAANFKENSQIEFVKDINNTDTKLPDSFVTVLKQVELSTCNSNTIDWTKPLSDINDYYILHKIRGLIMLNVDLRNAENTAILFLIFIIIRSFQLGEPYSDNITYYPETKIILLKNDLFDEFNKNNANLTDSEKETHKITIDRFVEILTNISSRVFENVTKEQICKTEMVN